MAENLNELAARIHALNIKWWQDPHTGKPLPTDEERTAMAVRLSSLPMEDDGSVHITPYERATICFMLTTRARNKGELLMLMVSEIAEAMEGTRKNLMDDKLPEFKMEDVELADLVIRLLDYCGGFNIDLQAAFDAKNEYNSKRYDHTHEARLAPGGKLF